MPIGIVDRLEVVNIEHDQSRLAVIAAMTGVIQAEHLFPVPAIVEPGKPISAGQALQLGVGGLELAPVHGYIGDVIDNQAHLVNAAAGAFEG